MESIICIRTDYYVLKSSYLNLIHFYCLSLWPSKCVFEDIELLPKLAIAFRPKELFLLLKSNEILEVVKAILYLINFT